ncbi:hypothetical protein S245_034698 [Arachis hypogaea]
MEGRDHASKNGNGKPSDTSWKPSLKGWGVMAEIVVDVVREYEKDKRRMVIPYMDLNEWNKTISKKETDQKTLMGVTKGVDSKRFDVDSENSDQTNSCSYEYNGGRSNLKSNTNNNEIICGSVKPITPNHMRKSSTCILGQQIISPNEERDSGLVLDKSQGMKHGLVLECTEGMDQVRDARAGDNNASPHLSNSAAQPGNA